MIFDEAATIDPATWNVEPEHSPKGASSAERWMNCSGSGVLLDKLKLPQSDEEDYRRDGIAAHEAAGHCLINGHDTWEIIGQTFHGVVVDQVMADAVQVYLSDVRQYMTESATIYVEQKIGEDPEKRPHPQFYGRIDFGAYDTDETVVEDFKYGEGIVVEPERNVQMMYYAYGLLIMRPNVRSDRVVRLRICQPRAYHEDGPVREWETTAGEIIHWAETELILAMNRASVEQEFDAGQHCRFCPAKLFCPLLTGLYGAAMRTDPKVIPNFGQQRMAQEYAQLEAVNFYVKALKDEVHRRNMLGNTVPGTKLVLKRANRVFKDGVVDAAKTLFGADAYTKPELKSPAEIDAIGPTGKDFTKKWAYLPNTGLTTAMESDKKPGVKVEKAADAFAHLISAGNAETATGQENSND